MIIGLIAAVSDNGVVANDDGSCPWRIRSDLRHFAQTTKGCALVVGRTTFDLLPRKMLDVGDRQFFVLSKSVVVEPTDAHGDDPTERRRAQWHLDQADDRYLPTNVHVVRGLDQAVYHAANLDCRTMWSVGGPKAWDSSLSYVNKIVLSRVHVSLTRGMVWQSALDLAAKGFHLSMVEHHMQMPGDEHDWSIEYWRRGR